MTATPSPDAPTEPSKEAHEAGKKLIGALVIMHGMGIHADRLNEAENEAALALDRFRAAGVREWQPIETAPQDGAEIDLFTRDGRRITDCWWHFDQRWVRRGPGHALIEQVAGIPTHWMPLPEPPHD